MNSSFFLGNGSEPSRQLRGQMPTEQDAAKFSQSAFRMPAEEGLVDISGMVIPHAMYGSVFKNPWFGPAMKRTVPDPSILRGLRKAKALVRDKGLMAAGAAVLGEEAYRGATSE